MVYVYTKKKGHLCLDMIRTIIERFVIFILYSSIHIKLMRNDEKKKSFVFLLEKMVIRSI